MRKKTQDISNKNKNMNLFLTGENKNFDLSATITPSPPPNQGFFSGLVSKTREDEMRASTTNTRTRTYSKTLVDMAGGFVDSLFDTKSFLQ